MQLFKYLVDVDFKPNTLLFKKKQYKSLFLNINIPKVVQPVLKIGFEY